MERVKNEIVRRLDHLMGLHLNDQNLMKAIDCRVIPVAGYVMNVCNLGKGELDEIDNIVKSTLRREGFHGRQLSDERLFTNRREGGRSLKNFKEVYDETKTRVACYMATSNNEWIKVAWKNEMSKEQTSLKREAEAAMRKMDLLATFGEGYVKINQERYVDWKEAWKKLKNKLSEGQKRNRKRTFAKEALQSEIPSKYDEADYGWLKCNTYPRKTVSIFALQEQMVEPRAWKKIRGHIEDDKCRLCGEYRETIQHLLSGCKKLAGSEYVKRHNNTLKDLVVTWAVEMGIMPEGTKWYAAKWEKGKVLENEGKRLYWDWKHKMRTNCTTRRPGLTLEDEEKKTMLLVDMACSNEVNRQVKLKCKREEKIKKYGQLCFELREVTGCLGRGMKELKTDMQKIFEYENEKELYTTMREMQKTVLWERESMIRKVLSGLLI